MVTSEYGGDQLHLTARVLAGGVRSVCHDDKSMKSNHEDNAPTSMNLSAPRPAWSKPSTVALSFNAVP